MTAVNDAEIITQLERQNLVGVLGGGVPPENFEFGGMSGGPMLAVTGTRILTHMLAGIIHQGPNTSADPGQALAGFELVRARRAWLHRGDGTLRRVPLGWRPDD